MRLLLHLTVFAAAALAGVNAQLERVQAVYILPMGNGMDQFLANRITRLGKIQVVADPMSADTILTDRIGEPFEQRLDALYGSNKPKPAEVKTSEEAAPEAPAVDSKDTKDTKDTKEAADAKTPDAHDAKALKDEKIAGNSGDAAPRKAAKPARVMTLKGEVDPVRMSSFGRGKGTFFLVDRRSRSVVWSIYERPKNSSADELNKTAAKVVNQLKQDLKPATATAGK